MNRFTDRTVVATGAGSDIGKATAERIVAEGGMVVAVDFDPERLKAQAEALPDGDVRTVAGDNTDADTITAIAAAAGDRIDGLANVVEIVDGFLPPAEMDDDTWAWVFAVNVTGQMCLTGAVLPGMIEAGAGTVVNVAFEAALRASFSGAAYTAPKHVLAGFTKGVAFFHGPQGIRANGFAPGAVLTNIESSMKSDYAAGRVGPILATTSRHPQPGAQPETLAAATTWLLSDDSANVNGVPLPGDGGWSVI